MAVRSSPAQPEPEAASNVPPASAKGENVLKGSDGLWSRSPSAANLSDSGSFASAESQDLDDALLEDDSLGRTSLSLVANRTASQGLPTRRFRDALQDMLL